MQWIKYKIICNADKNILLDKKLEYTEANLAIAKSEAYNGYTIVEDETAFVNEPIDIERGGTGAASAAGARAALEITLMNLEDIVICDSAPETATIVNGKWYLIKAEV